MAATDTVERTVKHKMFSYFTTEDGIKPDGSIGPVPVEYTARRGDTIQLTETEAFRGDKHGAFYTQEELEMMSADMEQVGEASTDDVALPAQGPSAPDLTEASVEEVQMWMEPEDGGNRPTVPRILSAVNNVPDEERPTAAEKVREAEENLDREARSTLVDALEAIETADEE